MVSALAGGKREGQIDGGMNFERVGYVCDCAGSNQVQTLWDGVESTRVTLV